MIGHHRNANCDMRYLVNTVPSTLFREKKILQMLLLRQVKWDTVLVYLSSCPLASTLKPLNLA